ncbi:uncharacterized protein, partial [Halyomorpha halys]|uniref:uncharacterized protein n=1 Tax=Halyomorpha halys TaxID=286706 RepID=UPI0034D3349B
MWNLCGLSLIFFFYLYSVNADLSDDGNLLSDYVSTYWKREADSGNSNSGNAYGNYRPSFTPPFDVLKVQECYEYTLAHLQESGYVPGTEGHGESRHNEEQSSSNNFANIMSNPQFQEIFKKCMEEGSPSSSSYKKREADSGSSGSSNPFSSYIPPGYIPQFTTTSWQKCWEYSATQLQQSGYFPGSGG